LFVDSKGGGPEKVAGNVLDIKCGSAALAEWKDPLEPRPPAIEVFRSGDSVRTIVDPKTLELFSLDRSQIVRRLADDRRGWRIIVLDEKKRPAAGAGAAGGGKPAEAVVGASVGRR
jgi:hypothetical protein